ncbi:hypothetical protein, partial [Dickeya solani]|uniref:hypothetical protein n=1 Tax=Dickeya solani TaxID=1089444 RepID=UPI0022A7C23D
LRKIFSADFDIVIFCVFYCGIIYLICIHLIVSGGERSSRLDELTVTDFRLPVNLSRALF